MMGFGLGGMLFGGLMMLAFWIIVIVGVIWLVAALARGGFTGARQASAGAPTIGQTTVDILKARYARGEITKEQFEEMKRDLGA